MAILIILAGVFLTLIALLAVLVAVALIPTFGAIVLVIAGVFLLLSILLLAAGFGLWHLRPWAWWLSVIVLILVIVNEFAGVTLANLRALTTVDLIIVGFPVLILIYLIAVRHHFRSPTTYTAPR